MGPSVVVVTDNDPDQFKSTGLLNWVRYSKNFLLLSVNPSGGGSTDFFTGSRGEEALFPFLFPGAPTGGPGLPWTLQDRMHQNPLPGPPLPPVSPHLGVVSRERRC